MRHVLDPKTNCNCTTLETAFKLHFHLGDFRVGCSSPRGLSAWHKFDRIAHRRHSCREMSNADTVVDQRLSLSLRVPAIDVSSADFQLQRRRHTVHCFEAIVLVVLAMLV